LVVRDAAVADDFLIALDLADGAVFENEKQDR